MTDVSKVLDRTGLYMYVGAPDIPWGPTGRQVYERTYSRVKPDGSREDWAETVARVVAGNLGLIHGDPEGWTEDVWQEATDLAAFMVMFKIVPAGRHLWASGVKGRQYLFNCHVAGWDSLAEHVDFTLMRLAEGGGVGANYSTRYLSPLGAPERPVKAHVVCDPSHPDYDAMNAAGVLSDEYDPSWPGAFEVEDTREGWSAAITDLIETAYRRDRRHLNRVYDVSRVRWSGARLKTMGGSASGPEPLARALGKIGNVLTGANARVRQEKSGRKIIGVDRRDNPVTEKVEPDYSAHSLTPLEAMDIDHAIAECIVAGGNRRSARMSIVRWDDPYVFEFINSKADHESHWSTNISVEIDDEFIDALSVTRDINPKNEHALKVHRAVVNGMLTNGEPGYWNSSLSNEGEPTPVVATNPCGEIALNPWENCNLGHVNLDAFVNGEGKRDTEGLEKAHRLMVRFLMRATYGDVIDSKQAAALGRNRRIGVGHFGTQGFLAKSGVRFTEAPSNPGFRAILTGLAMLVDDEARAYAHALRIPTPVKTRTVAPTGTIAKMPGRTEGAHPIYARHFLRRVRYSTTDPEQVRQVEALRAEGHSVEPCTYAANTSVVTFTTEDQLVSEVKAMGLDPAIVESADEISLRDMLSFQRVYQECWADNAVSFTVNVPAEPLQRNFMRDGYTHLPEPSEERLAEVMETLAEFLPDLKGTTLMLDGSRPQAPYERLTEKEFDLLSKSGLKVTTDAGYDEDCASGACPVK